MPLGPPIPPPSPGPLPPLPLPPSALIPFFPDLPWGFPFNRMPNMATIVQTPQSGRETRWGQQIYPQWEFELPFEELRDQTLNQTIYQPFVGFTQFQRLLGLFLLGMGRWGLFYFDDPADNSRAGQRIGTGDGSTKDFLIIRTWGIGAYQLTEPVGGINTGTAKVYLNGVLQVSGYSLTGADDAPKTLMFVSAPANGVVITMDFHFYYLCRFSDDQHNYEEFYKNRWTTNIKFRSVVA